MVSQLNSQHSFEKDQIMAEAKGLLKANKYIDTGCKLGEGTYGTVIQVVKEGKSYAAKIIIKSN